jgi:hypothetical protein
MLFGLQNNACMCTHLWHQSISPTTTVLKISISREHVQKHEASVETNDQQALLEVPPRSFIFSARLM